MNDSCVYVATVDTDIQTDDSVCCVCDSASIFSVFNIFSPIPERVYDLFPVFAMLENLTLFIFTLTGKNAWLVERSHQNLT